MPADDAVGAAEVLGRMLPSDGRCDQCGSVYFRDRYAQRFCCVECAIDWRRMKHEGVVMG
jgi:uncharacterized OB-fold protein